MVLKLKEIRWLPPQDVGAADGAEGPEEDSGSRSNNELEETRQWHFNTFHISMWTKLPVVYVSSLGFMFSLIVLQWFINIRNKSWQSTRGQSSLWKQFFERTSQIQRFCRNVLFSRFRSSRGGGGGGTVPSSTSSRRRLQGGNGIWRFGWGRSWRDVVCGRALEEKATTTTTTKTFLRLLHIWKVNKNINMRLNVCLTFVGELKQWISRRKS